MISYQTDWESFHNNVESIENTKQIKDHFAKMQRKSLKSFLRVGNCENKDSEREI